MLYHYAKLGGDPRYYKDPTVWGCDACKVAGEIYPKDDTGGLQRLDNT
jgi:hypothetical protein